MLNLDSESWIELERAKASITAEIKGHPKLPGYGFSFGGYYLQNVKEYNHKQKQDRTDLGRGFSVSTRVECDVDISFLFLSQEEVKKFVSDLGLLPFGGTGGEKQQIVIDIFRDKTIERQIKYYGVIFTAYSMTPEGENGPFNLQIRFNPDYWEYSFEK